MAIMVTPCTSSADVDAIEATAPTGRSAFHRKRFGRTDGSVYLLAWLDGLAVGHVLVTPESKYADVIRQVGRFPEVNALGVVASHRRRGVARALMSGACETASAMGGLRVGLAVEADNEPAVRLYESLRFKRLPELNPVDVWAWVGDDGVEHVERDRCAYWMRRFD